MFTKFPTREEGQGLVEYALILVLVAIVVIAILLQMGPAVGEAYCKITRVLNPDTSCSVVGAGSGAITNVSTTPAGPNISVSVTVSENVTVSASVTSGSGAVNPPSRACNGSCSFLINGASANGTVTVSDGTGSMSASW